MHFIPPVRILLLMTAMLLGTLPAFCHAENEPADRPPGAEELRQALERHPEVILDFLRDHKVELYKLVREGMKEQERRATARRMAYERQNPLEPEIDPSRPVLGDPQAPNTIFVYSDFLCTHCAQAAKAIDRLIETHPSQIRVFFKHYPSGQLSYLAALYFEAIARQSAEKAWEFHDILFESREELLERGPEMLEELVSRLGLDREKIHRDLEDAALGDRITRDMQEAEKFGFGGTPVLVVNGVSVREAVPLETLESLLGLPAGGAAHGGAVPGNTGSEADSNASEP